MNELDCIMQQRNTLINGQSHWITISEDLPLDKNMAAVRDKKKAQFTDAVNTAFWLFFLLK